MEKSKITHITALNSEGRGTLNKKRVVVIYVSIFRKIEIENTAVSAFLFHDRPVSIPSLGVLNRPTSLTVLNRT